MEILGGIALILLVLALAFAGSLFMGWLTMLVWNAVLVPWLHAPTLNFWLAVGVYVVLAAILRVRRGGGGNQSG